jgi:hypothetical protein
MTYLDEQGYPRLPEAGNEADTLLGALERIRATFAWKCGGPDSAGLQAQVGTSAITLGGLLKHMALVEDDYARHRIMGQEDIGAPWNAVDWDADPDWEWRTAADDTPEELITLWRDAVRRCRTAVDAAMTEGGLDRIAVDSGWDRPPNLRRQIVDLIEEYARHTGHADLIRETVDGLVGEDPPRD